MSIPLIQTYRIGKYILEQKLKGNKRYPLVLMLEPSFRCNLTCMGCGKIAYPEDTLRRRLSPAECIEAVEPEFDDVTDNKDDYDDEIPF